MCLTKNRAYTAVYLKIVPIPDWWRTSPFINHFTTTFTPVVNQINRPDSLVFLPLFAFIRIFLNLRKQLVFMIFSNALYFPQRQNRNRKHNVHKI